LRRIASAFHLGHRISRDLDLFSRDVTAVKLSLAERAERELRERLKR